MQVCDWCDEIMFYESVLKKNKTAFSVKRYGDTVTCCENCFSQKILPTISDKGKIYWEKKQLEDNQGNK